jgi:glycerol-3-phosphate dehydrogenase
MYLGYTSELFNIQAKNPNLDFDVAIIGCGAYGFPLAAHVKRMGKKSIHLGGATQILFGIKGKRWLDDKNFDNIINEHFVFPSAADKVNNYQLMEGGAYW